jgi:hypothetical protein
MLNLLRPKLKHHDIDHEIGICEDVVIEADTANKANEKAQDLGIYFNGVEDANDYECWGDR